MHEGRYAHGICFIKEFIYVTGGVRDFEITYDSCERYNILANEWSFIPPLDRPKYGVSIVAVNQRYIYMFGGKGNSDPDFDGTFIEVAKLDSEQIP